MHETVGVNHREVGKKKLSLMQIPQIRELSKTWHSKELTNIPSHASQRPATYRKMIGSMD